jgi:C4-dicarboxylate transporter DctQ subunit
MSNHRQIEESIIAASRADDGGDVCQCRGALRVQFQHLLWALELTVFMFAWLVLLGASYAVKKQSHLGVDALVNLMAPPVRRAMALFSVACCLVFTLLLLKGAWDYWAVFAKLPPTTGRWFPTGFETRFPRSGLVRGAGYPDARRPAVPRRLDQFRRGIREDSQGDPLRGSAGCRCCFWSTVSSRWRWMVWQGKVDRLIASHEVEDELDEVREAAQEEGCMTDGSCSAVSSW